VAKNAVQRTFRLITKGKDVVDALIAGVRPRCPGRLRTALQSAR
jgi:hypothetical protein